ncbi:NAD(P)/FAD-dependent oxidoreductase [bacterium]|nr:NAD(P)/FAD-dependent oxidoreductase [bacterium]
MEKTYDYGIIGAGPAGVTTALIAANNGKKVILFEKDKIGGICLNKGCIPTKTIMHSADLYRDAKSSENIGIVANDLQFDIAKVMEHKNKVTETLRNALTKTLQGKDVEVVNKEAKVTADKTIEADGVQYNCEKIIIATGSEPKPLKDYPFDHEFILNSDDLFELKQKPQKVLIVGAGAEGIEWARIFKDIDCEVTVAEAASRPLSIADEEVSKYVERLFKTRQINLKTSTTIAKIENKQVTLSNGDVLNPDFVLVAIGRIPLKPQIDGKATVIGDACGQLMLANFAMYQARALVSGIRFDNVFVPSVIYGTPEIAWIGANEQDLPYGSYHKAVCPVRMLGKAHCDNEMEGFVKVLTYENKIIGAHIISKEASAIIHQFAIAMQNEISVEELKKVCFAHPTYSEAVYESMMML